MPRIVDHDGRRREIAQLAMRLIAERGMSGLSMRALAEEMGGSLTLVTHYYPTRAVLLQDVVARVMEQWRDDLDGRLEAAGDARARLNVLLAWLLPLTEEGRELEWVRFALLVDRQDPEAHDLLLAVDHGMRDLLRKHLRELVDETVLEDGVDMLRAVTTGVALDAILDPDAWPASRQRRVVDAALTALLDGPLAPGAGQPG